MANYRDRVPKRAVPDRDRTGFRFWPPSGVRFWPQADVQARLNIRPLSGVKRSCSFTYRSSAFDPKADFRAAGQRTMPLLTVAFLLHQFFHGLID